MPAALPRRRWAVSEELALRLAPEELARGLQTCLSRGLSAQRVAAILSRDGPNELERPPRPSVASLFATQFTCFTTTLLLGVVVASVVLAATGPERSSVLSYSTGKMIAAIVLVNTGITTWVEHRADNAIEALSKKVRVSTCVLRDGYLTRIGKPAVVRGDVVVLSAGDVVPADLRLIDAEDMWVSELVLTGDPDHVVKTAGMPKPGDPERFTPDNMVFSGSSVLSGRARGIVCETGMSTRLGRVMLMIAEADRGRGAMLARRRCHLSGTADGTTPMQRHLERLTLRIRSFAVLLSLFLFFIGIGTGRADPSNPGSPSWLYMVLVASTLIVAAVPRGIKLCVTASLSIGCSDMLKNNVLVSRPAAVETLGSVSVICSNKTGTLTEGRMLLVAMLAGGVRYEVDSRTSEPSQRCIRREGTAGDAGRDHAVLSTFLTGLLCCNAALTKEGDDDISIKRWGACGSASEAAVVVAARQAGFGSGIAAEYRRVLEIPFSPARKSMLVLCDVRAVAERSASRVGAGMAALLEEAQFLSVCKGAPHVVLESCSKQLMSDGTSRSMPEKTKREVLAAVEEYASQALHVLAVAARGFAEEPFDTGEEGLTADQKLAVCQQDLCFLGLLACADAERDGAAEAVRVARGAGMRINMITSDNLRTAVSVARAVHILQPLDAEEEMAVDCDCLRPGGAYLPDGMLDHLTSRIRVFAAACPEDKLQIVLALQRQGAVVAAVGSAAGDAPALAQADVGLARGLAGTDVAMEAADMVLTDDNFCSLVAAVGRSRVMYSSIQKAVAFMVSLHLAEVAQVFFCVLAGVPVVRTPLQLLALALVVRLPLFVALSLEPGGLATKMQERPRPKRDPVVLDWMWLSMAMNAIVLSSVVIGVYLHALLHYCDGHIFLIHIEELEGFEPKLRSARTVAFVTLHWAEAALAYTSRSFSRPFWHNIRGNRYLSRGALVHEVCLVVLVFTPILSDRIVGLSAAGVDTFGWTLASIAPLVCLVLSDLCKLVTAVQSRRYQEKLARRQPHATHEMSGVLSPRTRVSFTSMTQTRSNFSSQSGGCAAKHPGAFEETVKPQQMRGPWSRLCSCLSLMPTQRAYSQ